MRKNAALCAVLLLVACGGSAAKPPSAPPPEPTSMAPSPEATDSASDAGSTASPSEVASAAPAPPAAPAAGAGGGVIAEGHDACSGVAAPFEEKVRAKFNECYQTGKKTNPELAGTIKVTLKIDMKGKVKYVPEPSKLDAKVVTCMVNAVKKEPIDAKACRGKDVAVSKTFGAP